ncbi:DUF1661 domain-containing protein [Porphyromonas gulae]|uniref:DUF1661 domain-containing protein n=1 Tax=Porphyromonas gulae TaxID=111105 RepID=UPI0034E96930
MNFRSGKVFVLVPLFFFSRAKTKKFSGHVFSSRMSRILQTRKFLPHITPYLSIISIGPIFLFVEKFFSLLILFLLRSFLFLLRARTVIIYMLVFRFFSWVMSFLFRMFCGYF